MRKTHQQIKWPIFARLNNGQNEQSLVSKGPTNSYKYNEIKLQNTRFHNEKAQQIANYTKIIPSQIKNERNFINQHLGQWPSWANRQAHNDIQDNQTNDTLTSSRYTNKEPEKQCESRPTDLKSEEKKKRNWHFKDLDKVPPPKILGRNSVLFYIYFTRQEKGLTYFFPHWGIQHIKYIQMKEMSSRNKDYLYKQCRNLYENKKQPVYVVKSQIALPILQKYEKQGTFQKKVRFRGLEHHYLFNAQDSKWYH